MLSVWGRFCVGEWGLPVRGQEGIAQEVDLLLAGLGGLFVSDFGEAGAVFAFLAFAAHLEGVWS